MHQNIIIYRNINEEEYIFVMLIMFYLICYSFQTHRKKHKTRKKMGLNDQETLNLFNAVIFTIYEYLFNKQKTKQQDKVTCFTASSPHSWILIFLSSKRKKSFQNTSFFQSVVEEEEFEQLSCSYTYTHTERVS